MNTCNKCGANLREGAKFCSKCGTHIKIKLFCHQCGIELEPADQFCYACDVSIQEENSSKININIDDFKIEDGVLIKYIGNGGDVVIPDGVKQIGSRAFENCSNIRKITIPYDITDIGSWTFRCCSLTEIGQLAFLNSNKLTLPQKYEKYRCY